jgi:uncharacterized protein YuzE
MRFRYDKEADALTIQLRDGVPVSRTEEVDTGTLVDLDRFGSAIAIEVIRPAREWPVEDIIARFGVDDESAQMLRSLWNRALTYPFTEPELVEA